VVQKGELDLAHDRYAELKRRHDQLRKDHDELVEAVRQAAREERRAAGAPPDEPGADAKPA
jgi:colicin import membrane protein